MSSSPLELPILISQLPHVAKLQNAEQAKPEIQRSMFAPLIAEHLRKDQQKVGKVDKKEAINRINRDGGKQGGGQAGQRQASGEEKDKDTNASESSPWSGNIVDMKV